MKAIILHSTCCYPDTVSMWVKVSKAPAFAGDEFCHVVTGGGICTYLPQLPPPAATSCAAIRGGILTYMRDAVESYFDLENEVGLICKLPELDGIRREIETGISLENITFRELNLWSVVSASIASYLEFVIPPKNLVSASPRQSSVIKEFLKASVSYIVAIDNILNREQPTHGILFNGHFYLERIFLERCRRRGVACLAYESSTFSNLRYISQTGATGNAIDWSSLSYDWISCRRLSSNQKARLQAFMTNRFAGAGHVIQQPARSGNLREELEIPPTAVVALFLGQVPHDSVIVRDPGAFDNLPAAIDACIDIFKRTLRDVYLIVKLHPGGRMTSLRTDYLAQRFSGVEVADNIRLLSGSNVNVYELMEFADIGITMSSQSGLEFLSLHKKLFVLGRAHYAFKGITEDVMDSRFLADALAGGLHDLSISDDRVEKIDAFLYSLIFEYLVPFNREAGEFSPESIGMIRNIISGRSRRYGLDIINESQGHVKAREI